jgi:hypothetical protein
LRKTDPGTGFACAEEAASRAMAHAVKMGRDFFMPDSVKMSSKPSFALSGWQVKVAGKRPAILRLAQQEQGEPGCPAAKLQPGKQAGQEIHGFCVRPEQDDHNQRRKEHDKAPAEKCRKQSRHYDAQRLQDCIECSVIFRRLKKIA